MSRRSGKGRDAVPNVAHVYEGPDVLNALLARAGSRETSEGVAALFSRALNGGEQRSEVIPRLFTGEPRFDSPDEARRLYGNLFGLWDRLAAGRSAPDDAPAVMPEVEAIALPDLPARGSQPGDVLSSELVEAVWRHLDASSPREVQRRRDRFENAQPDLVAWLESVPIDEPGALAASDLSFEAWAMFDQAFGDRVEAVSFRELRTISEAPPELEAEQPAFASYVGEQLDVLADEDPAFVPAVRTEAERVISIVAVALARAVRQPS
jgi:hypothetical protein